MSKPARRSRIYLRRAVRYAAGLVFVAVGILFLADVWHQWRLRQEVEQLQAVVAQVEHEVPIAVSAEHWHQARIQGSNGWAQAAFLWEVREKARKLKEEKGSWAVSESPEGRIWLAMEQLGEYARDDWRQPAPEFAGRNWKPRTDPTADELRDWLRATESMPAACRKAVECDVISPVPLEGTFTEDWTQSVPVLWSLYTVWAMTGRVKALVELEDTEAAGSELLTYACFWSKYTLPLSWSDGRRAAAAFASCMHLATELFLDGRLPATTIREVLALSLDGDQLFSETMVGDLVWAYLLVHREDHCLHAPAWFEWFSARRSTPPGDESHRYAFDRYGQRAEYCHEVRSLLMHQLQYLEMLRNPKPWDKVESLDIVSKWKWGFWVHTLPEQSMLFRRVNLAWLELRLRLLEHESGPLASQKPAVEDLLKDQSYAGYRWEGKTLVIFPVPIMEFAPGEVESGLDLQRSYEDRLDPVN